MRYQASGSRQQEEICIVRFGKTLKYRLPLQHLEPIIYNVCYESCMQFSHISFLSFFRSFFLPFFHFSHSMLFSSQPFTNSRIFHSISSERDCLLYKTIHLTTKNITHMSPFSVHFSNCLSSSHTLKTQTSDQADRCDSEQRIPCQSKIIFVFVL